MDLSSRDGRRQQGERIKLAAREAGLSLDELARVIGCSRALIFQYASGASLPQTDRLQQIARSVSKPLYWFFLEADSEAGTTDGPVDAANPQSTTELQVESKRMQAEIDHLTLNQTRLEQALNRDEIFRLETLLAAASSPVDFRKVVECCTQLQPLLSREEPEKLAAILLKHGNALIQLQDWGAAKEKLEAAHTIYRQAGMAANARDCMQSVGHANLMLGRVQEALQQFEHVSSGDDWTNRWQGTLSIGAANEMLGEYAAAVTAFESALAIVEEKKDQPEIEVPTLYIEANWANVELDYGDYNSALARSVRCIRLAQRHGIQDQYIEAILTSAVAQVHLGDIESSSSLAQQALDVSLLNADRQHQSLALSCLSGIKSTQRRPDSAIRTGKEALALALRCGALRAELLAQRALCESYLASATPQEAIYHAEQGFVTSVSSNLHLPQVQFLVLKAKAYLAIGDIQECIACGIKALSTADALEVRPAQFDVRLTLARAYFDAADFTAAEQNCSLAVGLSDVLGLLGLQWKSHALLAVVLNASRGMQASEAQTIQALALLSSARAACSRLSEVVLMEDPIAILLWQNHLQNILETKGYGDAQVVAESADWPPLTDWLASVTPNTIQHGGQDV